MHTYIMSFQRVCCWFAEAFDLGFCPGSSRAPTSLCRRRGGGGGGGRGGGVEDFDPGVLSGVELCADFIVSAAAHRSILVGGGVTPVPKNWRRGGVIVTF